GTPHPRVTLQSSAQADLYVRGCSQNSCCPNCAATQREVFVGSPRLKLVVPATENRTVRPKRAMNSALRTREYLTEHEIETLVCTENLIRIDCVAESPNVNGDDRALLPLPDSARQRDYGATAAPRS